MNTTYFKYRVCITAIESEDCKGEKHIGTGFHVGDGLIVTARHVIDGMKNIRVHGTHNNNVIVQRTYFPSNALVDVAIIQTDFNLSYYMNKVSIAGATWEKIDYLPLGIEWDDFADDSLVLYDVIVMGYPPIPTAFPTLVTIRAQVNAIVDQYPSNGKHPPPSYILSGIPRGGFSGAPMLVDGGENSFVLGVVTSSLVQNHQYPESGFMAAVTIESVINTLHEHALYPKPNALAVKAFASELTDEEEKRLLSE